MNFKDILYGCESHVTSKGVDSCPAPLEMHLSILGFHTCCFIISVLRGSQRSQKNRVEWVMGYGLGFVLPPPTPPPPLRSAPTIAAHGDRLRRSGRIKRDRLPFALRLHRLSPPPLPQSQGGLGLGAQCGVSAPSTPSLASASQKGSVDDYAVEDQVVTGQQKGEQQAERMLLQRKINVQVRKKGQSCTPLLWDQKRRRWWQ
jgi:hypothetical protein